MLAAAGCGGGNHKVPAADVHSYLAAVEKVRLPVNTLLNGADPILDAYHDNRITPAQASARMGALEQTFAGYSLQMQEIEPSNRQLKTIAARSGVTLPADIQQAGRGEIAPGPPGRS